jgi:RecJ-like exonuclease
MKDEERAYSVECESCNGKGYTEAEESEGGRALSDGYGCGIGFGVVCGCCNGTGKQEVVEHYAVEG